MTNWKRIVGRIRSRLPSWALAVLGSNVLVVSLLATTVLNCPEPDPKKRKHIDVPFVPQERSVWCAAACVQMWGKYLHPDFQTAQSTVANVTGWFGAEPIGIINALRQFVGVTAQSYAYPPPNPQPPFDQYTMNQWQDLLMSAQPESAAKDKSAEPNPRRSPICAAAQKRRPPVRVQGMLDESIGRARLLPRRPARASATSEVARWALIRGSGPRAAS